MDEFIVHGFPICAGIAIAPPYFFSTFEDAVPEFAIPRDQIDAEVARYYRALKNSRRDLLALQKRLQAEGGLEAVAILHAHLEITRDPVMTVDVEKEIRRRGKNTEYAFKSVIGEYEKRFSRITNQFFQARVKDFQDISRRIICHLNHHKPMTLASITKRTIIFANELSPSATAEANTTCIDAFVTRGSAETSHVAIMARARGIPFVSNVDFPIADFATFVCVIVDGQTGDVIFNPRPETLEHYQLAQKKLNTPPRKGKGPIAETTDGLKIRLSANIESLQDAETLHKYRCEGIGLFRSEYLFLTRDAFPSEEEQFTTYHALVERVQGKSVVIRTFDIGGDKLGSFYPSRYEKNPYLGCRAIRLMLKELATFKTQLRAILRATAYGDVRILLPMISEVVELQEAKAVIAEVKHELTVQGVPFNRNAPLGCMIEVPSAALTTDILAAECDFFSIGTNDLVQYSLAVDRNNPAMSHLYTPTHPCILRLIQMILEKANRAEKPVSLCGEIAADPRFTALLIGLGVQEFSLAPSALSNIRNVIRKLSLTQAQEIAAHALTLTTHRAVDALLEEHYSGLNGL